MPPSRTAIRCTNCGQPVQADVRTVIDVQSDPQGKALLMSGRLNVFPCPACGHVNRLVAPLLYHDADKQLLIAQVPGEVLRGQTEEKVVGELLNDLTRNLPKDQFRAYMFNPKRALTMQGLIEQVMQADGITPEMMEAQKKRVDLLQQMISAPSAEGLKATIEQNDAQIDMEFFQTMRLMAQRLVAEGRPDIASQIVAVQEALLENSTFGKSLAAEQHEQESKVQAVAESIQQLGNDATRADFLALAQSYADDEHKLQALVGLVRPAFDEQFFQEFALKIQQASEAERPALEELYANLEELAGTLDDQVQETLQQTAQFLQVLLNSPNADEMLEANAHLINDDFMMILTSNIQESERRQDFELANRLKEIYGKVVELLRSQMSPELRFLNELLTTPDANVRQQMLVANQGKFDGVLLETAEAVANLLKSQGAQETLERLHQILPELPKLLKPDA